MESHEPQKNAEILICVEITLTSKAWLCLSNVSKAWLCLSNVFKAWLCLSNVFKTQQTLLNKFQSPRINQTVQNMFKYRIHQQITCTRFVFCPHHVLTCHSHSQEHVWRLQMSLGSSVYSFSYIHRYRYEQAQVITIYGHSHFPIYTPIIVWSWAGPYHKAKRR